jgi:hypothetical protein
MGERKGVYRVLVGKSAGKRPLGRHRRRWYDNIKMDLKWDVAVWIGTNLLRIGTRASTCECVTKPPGSVKCGEFLE